MTSIHKERKKLSIPDRDVFDDMNMYLLTKNLNDLIRKDILLDILGMFQENEKRGIKINDVIDNYETFCDEIAKNAIQKTKWESLFWVLQIIGLIPLTVILYNIIIYHQYTGNNYLLISADSIGFPIIIIGGIFISNIRNKMTYRLPFGKWYLFAFLYFTIAILCTIFVQHIVEYDIKISIFTFCFIILFNIVSYILYYIIRNTNYKKYINSK